MNKIYIGIDPGQKGAIVTIDKRGDIIDVIDAPTSVHDRVNELRKFTSRLPENDFITYTVKAALEKSQSYPGQGVSSVHSTGLDRGWWEGILAAFSIPYELVRPQEWQKIVGGTKPKKASKPQIKAWVRDGCLRKWPDHRDLFTGPRGGIKDGRCDALMIAEWLRLRG